MLVVFDYKLDLELSQQDMDQRRSDHIVWTSLNKTTNQKVPTSVVVLETRHVKTLKDKLIAQVIGSRVHMVLLQDERKYIILNESNGEVDVRFIIDIMMLCIKENLFFLLFCMSEPLLKLTCPHECEILTT